MATRVGPWVVFRGGVQRAVCIRLSVTMAADSHSWVCKGTVGAWYRVFLSFPRTRGRHQELSYTLVPWDPLGESCHSTPTSHPPSYSSFSLPQMKSHQHINRTLWFLMRIQKTFMEQIKDSSTPLNSPQPGGGGLSGVGEGWSNWSGDGFLCRPGERKGLETATGTRADH